MRVGEALKAWRKPIHLKGTLNSGLEEHKGKYRCFDSFYTVGNPSPHAHYIGRAENIDNSWVPDDYLSMWKDTNYWDRKLNFYK